MPHTNHSRSANRKPLPPADRNIDHQTTAGPPTPRTRHRLKSPSKHPGKLNPASPSGLEPVWMKLTPLTDGAGHDWDRGPSDQFSLADVDGDGQAEIVIYNNDDLYTGVLKWQNGTVQPVWMSKSPLTGPVNWDRTPADTLVVADVDGDGQAEIVIYYNFQAATCQTGVLKWQGGALVPVWRNTDGMLPGPKKTWDRGYPDVLVAADVDGDGQDEIVIYNNNDDWTGVLKWQGGALVPVWMVASPLVGPRQNWDRGDPDVLVAADVDGDGQTEIVIYNNNDDYTGVLKWQGGALVPVWMSGTPLVGPGHSWDRAGDSFVTADVDGDGQTEIVIYNNYDQYTGVLKWQGGALVPIWVNSTGGLSGSAGTGTWTRQLWDVFSPADVDGDRQQEIVIYNNAEAWTGVLKWQGGALVPVWLNTDAKLPGPPGTWDRGEDDGFSPADVDGDGQAEIVIYNNDDRWTGWLKWNL